MVRWNESGSPFNCLRAVLALRWTQQAKAIPANERRIISTLVWLVEMTESSGVTFTEKRSEGRKPKSSSGHRSPCHRRVLGRSDERSWSNREEGQKKWSQTVDETA
jgi:hypothetical protein